MSKTESSMLALGTRAPEFALRDTVSDRMIQFGDIAGTHGTLVMFICNHCPFVKHVIDELVTLGQDYLERGIGMVAISSNDVTGYPQDRPERMKELAREMGFGFPYLHDETQETARAYSATCTPDFFVFDASRSLVYRGQLDDSRPGNGIPVTGRDLRAAFDALLAGENVSGNQKPSIGCNIKWKDS
ncbi:MAG: thioredoxin family protein [Wenzhouxiangella sp.]|jgi:peroxiredoxin|nr:thioredoxin family protein [Wenzhouxiangella sp.]